MLALPQEYVGSLTEIKGMNNELLAMGRIIKIDTDALEIAANEGERMPLLQYRTPAKLFVQRQNQPTRIMVGVVYLSTENFVRLEEVKPLQDFERRGAFRVNTNVCGHMFAALDPEEQAAYDEALAAATPPQAQEMQARHEFEVQILDVSLAGVRIKAQASLVCGARYYIEFTLINAAMRIGLKIQRIIKTPNGDTQYGCIYFDYTERQMNALCRELFQLQRLEKSRRRDNLMTPQA